MKAHILEQISNNNYWLYFIYPIMVLAILASFLVIFAKNPIHSIFNLILAFIAVIILLFTLNIEFIPIIFLIVYVGAISVLFLFVVMMLNIQLIEISEKFFNYLPIGSIIGLILLSELFIFSVSEFLFIESPFVDSFLNLNSLVYINNYFEDMFYFDINWLDAKESMNKWSTNLDIYNFIQNTSRYIDCNNINYDYINWINLDIDTKINELNWYKDVLNNSWECNNNVLLGSLQQQNNDIIQIAEILYESLALPFIVASLVLLVAMIASIILTLTVNRVNTPNIKRQYISDQVYREISLKIYNSKKNI